MKNTKNKLMILKWIFFYVFFSMQVNCEKRRVKRQYCQEMEMKFKAWLPLLASFLIFQRVTFAGKLIVTWIQHIYNHWILETESWSIFFPLSSSFNNFRCVLPHDGKQPPAAGAGRRPHDKLRHRQVPSLRRSSRSHWPPSQTTRHHRDKKRGPAEPRWQSWLRQGLGWHQLRPLRRQRCGHNRRQRGHSRR